MGNRHRVSRWSASRRRARVCCGGAPVARDIERESTVYEAAGACDAQSAGASDDPAPFRGEAPAPAASDADTPAAGEAHVPVRGEAPAPAEAQVSVPDGAQAASEAHVAAASEAHVAAASEAHARSVAGASDPINAFVTALANTVKLSLAILAARLSLELSAAMRQIADLLQELSREIAQVRASLEAMPQGTPKAREAKAASVAIIAAIEAKHSLNLSPRADAADKPCAELALFVDGELEAERAAMFRAHLPGCEECRTELLEAEQLAARLSQRKEPT